MGCLRCLLLLLVGWCCCLATGQTARAQQEHVVFITSFSYGVDSFSEPNPIGLDFGGSESADFLATNHAINAGLANVGVTPFDRTWKALISTSAENARDRVPIVGRVVNTNGDLLAIDEDDFWDGRLLAGISYDENGTLLPTNTIFWSGSDSGGLLDRNCLDWSTTGGQMANIGLSQVPVNAINQAQLSCGSAYHLVAIGPPEVIDPGDYNDDGEVTADDLAVWQEHFGSTTNVRADGDFDNDVDGADFLVWQRQLGAKAASQAVTTVPEPSTWWSLVLGLLMLSFKNVRFWDTFSGIRSQST